MRATAIAVLALGVAAVAPGCNGIWGVTPGVLGDTCTQSLCLTLEVPKERPGYDVASGASGLEIDGSGVVSIFVYVEDPYASRGSGAFKVVTYPEAAAGEVKVEDLPKTVGVDLAPGNYWILARFEDRKIARPGDFWSLQPGDFFALAPVKVSLVAGAAGRADVPLQAGRRILLAVTADRKMSTDYAGKTVNGDGVWYYDVFDGDPMAGTYVYIDGGGGPCINLAPLSPTPPTLNLINLTGAPPGKHRLFFYLDDFDALSSWTGASLPPGTLESGDGAAAPTFEVTATSWITKATVTVNHVESPWPSGTPDPMRCP